MSAALLRRSPRAWRSTALTVALRRPPRNHSWCGAAKRRVAENGVAHSTSAAFSAQKAAGSAAARARSAPSSIAAAAASQAGGWIGLLAVQQSVDGGLLALADLELEAARCGHDAPLLARCSHHLDR
jgi:hypothetical protein